MLEVKPVDFNLTEQRGRLRVLPWEFSTQKRSAIH